MTNEKIKGFFSRCWKKHKDFILNFSISKWHCQFRVSVLVVIEIFGAWIKCVMQPKLTLNFQLRIDPEIILAFLFRLFLTSAWMLTVINNKMKTSVLRYWRVRSWRSPRSSSAPSCWPCQWCHPFWRSSADQNSRSL